MLFDYIQAALEKAKYKQLEDNTWFAEIPEFEGVWANGKTVEGCRKELIEVLEDWMLLKLRDNDPLPVIKGLESISKKRHVRKLCLLSPEKN